jgi:hypothetical protein
VESQCFSEETSDVTNYTDQWYHSLRHWVWLLCNVSDVRHSSLIRNGDKLIRGSLAARTVVQTIQLAVVKIAQGKNPNISSKRLSKRLSRTSPFVSCDSGTGCCCGK